MGSEHGFKSLASANAVTILRQRHRCSLHALTHLDTPEYLPNPFFSDNGTRLVSTDNGNAVRQSGSLHNSPLPPEALLSQRLSLQVSSALNQPDHHSPDPQTRRLPNQPVSASPCPSPDLHLALMYLTRALPPPCQRHSFAP